VVPLGKQVERRKQKHSDQCGDRIHRKRFAGTLLRSRPVPADVNLLSIDIDGNDYHVRDAIRRLRPKLVVIEFNPTIANAVRIVQERRRLGVTHGVSAASLIDLGRAKGYELIVAIPCNLIFVDSCYFTLFDVALVSEAFYVAVTQGIPATARVLIQFPLYAVIFGMIVEGSQMRWRNSLSP
jgi:hypothetical protein